MYIFTDGIDFGCPNCKIEAVADRGSDVHAVSCNDDVEYYVVCPNCGIKIKIKPEEIPAHIKPYVKVEKHGLMTCHD